MPGVSIYWPLGYPTMESSIARCIEAIDAGADWLELGFPYSDPVADGPVIEAATAQALRNGTTVAQCLEAARTIHEARPDTPLVAMTYANLAYQLGWDKWAIALRSAGIAGCILPDVPLEESGSIRAELQKNDVAWHPLVTPSTPASRVEAICKTATGFVYVVSSAGITGLAGPGNVDALVGLARQHAPDVAVGFGIRDKADVARIWATGAHAIIGSEAVRHEGNLGAYVASLR